MVAWSSYHFCELLENQYAFHFSVNQTWFISFELRQFPFWLGLFVNFNFRLSEELFFHEEKNYILNLKLDKRKNRCLYRKYICSCRKSGALIKSVLCDLQDKQSAIVSTYIYLWTYLLTLVLESSISKKQRKNVRM